MEAAAPRYTPDSPMRIALVSPRGPLYRHRGGVWKKGLRYAPLTLTTLAALIPDDVPHTVTLVDEGLDEIDPNLDADLIGLSLITGTAPRGYELAAHFRARGIPVVIGGVHATLCPDEAQRHADAVVVGYAEDTWPQLLRDHQHGRMQPRYVQSAGVTLAGRPHPKRRLLGAPSVAVPHTLEATRGCQHRCDFCVVPTAWGRPIQRPVHEVIDDIRQMKARRLLFLDLNLIGDEAYARELWTAMLPLKLTWGGLVTTMLAWNDDLLDLAARSGCRGLLIGFESLSPASLKETHKGFNLHRDYGFVMRQMHRHRIAVQGCFVFGFDHDTTDVFDQTADFALEHAIDLPRFSVQTPFPGTPLFAKLKAEGRLLTEDWTYYDGQHVVYQPAQMTPEELLEGTNRTWQKVYSLRGIASRLGRARNQLAVGIPANLGYRFYAKNLHRYYTCDAPPIAAG